MVIEGDCECDLNLNEGEFPTEKYDGGFSIQPSEQIIEGSLDGASLESSEAKSAGDPTQQSIERFDDGHAASSPSLLKRFASWLSISHHSNS